MEPIIKNVSEPWFSFIKMGVKKIEGRLYKGDWTKLKIGDIIIFSNNEMGFERFVKVIVTDLVSYSNFEEYLTKEGVDTCLPSIDFISDGIKVYRNYFTEDDEKKFGIIAVKFTKYPMNLDFLE